MDMVERIAKLEAQVEVIKDDVTELKTDVKDLHSRITTGNREIIEKIEAMETKIEDRMKINANEATQQLTESKREIKAVSERVDILERWRWMIVGGAVVIGYLISRVEIFYKLLG